MARHHQERLPATAEAPGRSVMARASDWLPFRPYVYRGVPGPVIGAPRREPVRDPLAERELAGDAPAPPAVRCDDCGCLTTAPGHAIQCGGGNG